MDLSVSPAGMRVVNILVECPHSTITEITDKVNVTRTAVTEQLEELIAQGYVVRNQKRLPSRGRPNYRYSVTQYGLSQLYPGNQNILVPAIWEAVRRIGGDNLLKEVHCITADIVAMKYLQSADNVTSGSVLERAVRLKEMLEKEGVHVQVEQMEDGKVLFRKCSCPFISMYDPSGSVCVIDTAFIARFTSCHVQQVKSRHLNGEICCEFLLSE